MPPSTPPDYYPKVYPDEVGSIICPGNVVENSGNQLQTGVFDYHPFGMQMPDRSHSATATGYRYGFNSQEKDDEIYGTGNSYTAEFWQYDPRIGRRWNVDPVVKVHESPYAAFANNPIWLIDVVGADTSFSNVEASKDFRKIYNDISNAIDDMNIQIQFMSNELSNSNLDEVQTKVLTDKIASLNNERNGLINIKNSLDDIINAETMFYFSAEPNPNGKMISGGSTQWDEKNKRFVIQYYSGNFHTVVHESKHGQQHLNGNLRIYDYMDELDAFGNAENFKYHILKIERKTNEELVKYIEHHYFNRVQVPQWQQYCRTPEIK